jgi:pyruvate dehydrogenase E2 component (dihydrolipoamide acetyltransferase)
VSERTYTLAELAPELDEAVLVQWHVREGQAVAADADLVDVVTDKATITIPAPAGATIVRLAQAVDARLRPDSVMCSVTPLA